MMLAVPSVVYQGSLLRWQGPVLLCPAHEHEYWALDEPADLRDKREGQTQREIAAGSVTASGTGSARPAAPARPVSRCRQARR